MTKEELESKLVQLRAKWTGKVPKNSTDKNWWAFKCDQCLAIRFKSQIDKLNRGLESKAEAIISQTVSYEQAKAIFMDE